jgi:hypothetical protein
MDFPSSTANAMGQHYYVQFALSLREMLLMEWEHEILPHHKDMN